MSNKTLNIGYTADNHRLSINIGSLSPSAHLAGFTFDDSSIMYWGPNGEYKWTIKV